MKRAPILLTFNNEETKNLTRSLFWHIKEKTGYSFGQIALKALHEYNLKLDEKGNKKT